MDAGDKGKMKKAKQQKRNCVYGILLAAAVCMASGCGNNSKDDENVIYENSTEAEDSIETKNSTETENNRETENSTEAENGTETENSTGADDNKVTDIPEDSKEEKKDIIGDLVYENLQQLFDGITDDMLNACEGYPSFETYWNAPLIHLNQFKNVRLYGLRVDEETAMLLDVGGEKVFIETPFNNIYQQLPGLNVCDIDNDGMDEIIIHLRTITGHIRRYALQVCDYEEKWNIYTYDDYLQDIEAIIKYRYDDKSKVITFLDNEGNVLWEGKLPEWTNEYPYRGVVNFEDDMGFNAETFQMDVVPRIELKNSLPLDPIEIIFNLSFTNGEFKIESYDIQPNDLYHG